VTTTHSDLIAVYLICGHILNLIPSAVTNWAGTNVPCPDPDCQESAYYRARLDCYLLAGNSHNDADRFATDDIRRWRTAAEAATYHRARAKALMVRSGGETTNISPLALWAEKVVDQGRVRVGVVVARSGRLIAETFTVPSGPGTCGGVYVTKLLVPFRDSTPSRVIGSEVGITIGTLATIAGEPVIVVKDWEVCRGPRNL